jgi:hypothetical protein
VSGYKLLLLAFFDGKSTLPVDFSLHAEKRKKGDYGFTARQRKNQFKKKRSKGLPNYTRYKEVDESKLEMAVFMIKQAWQKGIRAKYALTDSWFTCPVGVTSGTALSHSLWEKYQMEATADHRYSIILYPGL